MFFTFAFMPNKHRIKIRYSIFLKYFTSHTLATCKGLTALIYTVQIGLVFVSWKMHIRNVPFVFGFGSPELI